MKISIIIPAYNVEDYIEGCLLSTINQDLPIDEYEVIVANDGSTDSTYEKIVAIAANRSNFVVINKENEWVSLTRNRCFDVARGEYILFVDSDDTIKENCLGLIYNKMRNNNLDILEFDFRNVDVQGKEIHPKMYHSMKSRPVGAVMSGYDYLAYYYDVIPMVWVRAYSRDFLIKNNLRMINLKHEDENFTPKAIFLAERIEVIKDVIYNYLIRPGSVTASRKRSNYLDTIDTMADVRAFLTNHPKGNPAVTKWINDRVSLVLHTSYYASVRSGLDCQCEIIDHMKSYGIYPFKNRFRYRFIYRLSTPLFVRLIKNKG